MAAVTRGFLGRRAPGSPPAARAVRRRADWPVLTAEPTPRITPRTGASPSTGSSSSRRRGPGTRCTPCRASEYRGDIHCVTTWSKFGTRFTGVSVDTLLGAPGRPPRRTFVMATSRTGYTTNLPLDDVTGGKAWVVWEYEGEPLPVEHGGPVRLLVPHLYFWKSAKWISRLTLLDQDQPGFWEQNGYHDRGDPWREQRYQGD